MTDLFAESSLEALCKCFVGSRRLSVEPRETFSFSLLIGNADS